MAAAHAATTAAPSGGGGFLHALLKDLGHSRAGADAAHAAPRSFGGFAFPEIPEGAQTTLVWVPFPVTSGGPTAATQSVEDAQVLGVFIVAALIWALPVMCVNQKCCCRCFRGWMSRRLGSCFCLGLLLNVAFISTVIAMAPDVTANGLFFGLVNIIGQITENTEQVLTQLVGLFAIAIAFLFRKRIIMLLGYDQQMVRADLRDICTCFTMHRFRVVEVTILKIEGLPPSGFGGRTLFCRLILGYNEAQHSRAHDGCTTSVMLKERLQMNYDPEDNSQKLTITVKQQEVVGSAVAQMAPVAGAVVGAAINTFTFVGTGPGAALGAVTGVGAANSLGKEVARIDLSSSQINRLREHFGREAVDANATGPLVPWREENFQRVDLVPQGSLWLRITDVADA